jgi:hypothetical protein
LPVDSAGSVTTGSTDPPPDAAPPADATPAAVAPEATTLAEAPPEAVTPAEVPPTGSPRRGRFKDLPVWVQAVTAILGVVLAAIGVGLTAIQLQDRQPTPTPIVLQPEAFIQQVTIDADQVKASGRFRNVDLAAQIVLFMGCASDTGDRLCLPVQASVSPQAAAPGVLVDGDWSALRPFIEKQALTWWATVVPAGIGATDGLADIRIHGPTSSFVIAASEPFRTED